MLVMDQRRAQTRLVEPTAMRYHTVFTPPGIIVEQMRHNLVIASVLATPTFSDHLAIYDHPRAWRGLSQRAILTMREHLYAFQFVVDSRMSDYIDTIRSLQTLALSVTPVAIGVEAGPLPPRHLVRRRGLLPTGPAVSAVQLEILSEPEASTVAKRVCERDIPAAEGIWRLLDYDYTIDQVARFLSLGMLGTHSRRRLVPTRVAYRVVINTFAQRVRERLEDQPTIENVRILRHTNGVEDIIVVAMPGPADVRYVEVDKRNANVPLTDLITKTDSGSDGPQEVPTAEHARFAAFTQMLRLGLQCDIVLLHRFVRGRSQLGPWSVRAAVDDAVRDCLAGAEMQDVGREADTITDALARPVQHYFFSQSAV